jgi:hypothetical protein
MVLTAVNNKIDILGWDVIYCVGYPILVESAASVFRIMGYLPAE